MKKIWIALIVCILLGIGMVWLFPMEEDLSLSIEYSRKYDNDFHAQLFWNTGEGYEESSSSYRQVEHNRVELEINTPPEKIREFRFDPVDEAVSTAITSIQVKNHGIGMKTIPVRNLAGLAQFHSLEQPEVKRGVLYLEPQSDDPAIIIGQDMVAAYFQSCGIKFKEVLTVWILLAGITAALGILYAEYLKNTISYIAEHFYTITKVILIIALFLIGYMAFNSFDYAHPDENMSKAAVDYYMTHWKPADIRSPEVADSFSIYGSSRLSEMTVYYFLAGKVAWIAKNAFGLEKYYRAFNVLLFAMMVGIYCKKGKKNSHLFLLGLTPQVWYIFSYATSDALDYFCMFVIIYQLLTEESMLNIALEKKKMKDAIFPLIIMGVIFGILLLGKKNYYFVFIISAFILLDKLVKSKNKVLFWKKYAIIISACIGLFLCRYGYDYVQYDGNKTEIKQKVQLEYAEEEYLPDESGKFQNTGVQMKSKGIPLNDLFETYHWGRNSFKSFAGTYGWMEYASGQLYYLMVAILYFIIIGSILVGFCQKGNGNFLITVGINIVIPATIFLSLLNSWIADFQAQGRYLFPVIGVLAYDHCVMGKMENIKNKQKISSCMLCVLGIYSYIFVGIQSLI